ncbi:MAG: hypothetical protein QGH39_05155 [Candidatus Thermoplasmatota archaeon]|jgi:hypothetical protein|nr:hypothetical protein [Candidatus Thermoplasmatota archaeon]MDP7264933.1 hypothetical protein [Candidatus Thermoplasmatota archaeon]
MTIRITIRDADTGSKVEMDLEEDNSIEETIESAASYWEKEAGAYVLRYGKKVLRGQTTIGMSAIRDGDLLELIPDPEGGY